MAKKMNYTDTLTGAVYPESTWIPLAIYIDFSRPAARVEFLGYLNEATARGVLMHALGTPEAESMGVIGTRSYTLTEAEVRSFAASAPTGATLLDALAAKCYELDATRATPFFAGAVDVDLTP